MPKYKAIRVSLTTPDGEVIDDFMVCHWRSDDAGSFSDEENIGSQASNALLMARIMQYVEPA